MIKLGKKIAVNPSELRCVTYVEGEEMVNRKYHISLGFVDATLIYVTVDSEEEALSIIEEAAKIIDFGR